MTVDFIIATNVMLLDGQQHWISTSVLICNLLSSYGRQLSWFGLHTHQYQYPPLSHTHTQRVVTIVSVCVCVCVCGMCEVYDRLLCECLYAGAQGW